MPQPAFDLSGLTALVTGASRGLGQSIAIGLAEAGASVAITARKPDDLAKTRAAIEAAGSRAFPMQLDVQDIPDMQVRLQTLGSETGGFDILVNNAGYEQTCPSADVTEALWDKINDTNLKGAFFCAQQVARDMIERERSGSIINVCSLTSYVGVPTAVPYTASKSGLLGMTRALSAEWAPRDIRVNAIAPGYFRTELTEQFYQDQDWQQAMLEKIPQGRFGNMCDLQGAVVFLASPASAYVTGQCLGIDGGYLAAL